MILWEGHICGRILTKKKLWSKCCKTLDKLKFKDII